MFFHSLGYSHWASLIAQMVKHLPAMQEARVQSLGWKIPWRREWQPTPVFLPGESYGQKSLVGYSIWGLKELDTTEHISMHDGRTAMWMCLMLLTCIVPCKVLLVASWPAGFSGDTQSSVVFPSVEEYSIVCCDPHYHKP